MEVCNLPECGVTDGMLIASKCRHLVVLQVLDALAHSLRDRCPAIFSQTSSGNCAGGKADRR